MRHADWMAGKTRRFYLAGECKNRGKTCAIAGLTWERERENQCPHATNATDFYFCIVTQSCFSKSPACGLSVTSARLCLFGIPSVSLFLQYTSLTVNSALIFK